MSSCRNEEAIAEPFGTIDPDLDLICFWNGEKAIAALTFYASHPQSNYGRGGVTPDTVGLARNRRMEETGVFHIHFDGAGGNIAAGKFNNGSPEARSRFGRADPQWDEDRMGKPDQDNHREKRPRLDLPPDTTSLAWPLHGRTIAQRAHRS